MTGEERKTYVIPLEMEGERIDRILSELLPDLSRSYLKKLLDEGKVTGGGKTLKPSARMKEGQEVELLLPEKVLPDIEPENIPLDILYEDNDVLVVNKPKDMVVHPAPGHMSGTLVNAVMYHCAGNLSGINGVLRPGIVHRIDKDTTGSLIICKNDAAHRSIARQLKDHTIVRRYRAICYGVLDQDDVTIDAPIGRDPKDRTRMAIVPDGKRAVTHVHVLERYDGYTYVECRLETGRTHQIRVHMASIGHPLIGDTLYGEEAALQEDHIRSMPEGSARALLHAADLSFRQPFTGEKIHVKAPLPADFREAVFRYHIEMIP